MLVGTDVCVPLVSVSYLYIHRFYKEKLGMFRSVQIVVVYLDYIASAIFT